MLKCLLLTFFLITFHGTVNARSTSTYRDLLFNTHVRYQEDDTRIQFKNISDKSVRVTFPQFIERDSLALFQLNNQIKNISESILQKKRSYDQFFKFFQESIETEVRVQSDGGFIKKSVLNHTNGFVPEINHITYQILSLCKNVVILSFDVKFTAMNEEIGEHFVDPMIYSELHYFDLNTGEELDKGDIISPEKKMVFNQDIRNRIPQRFQNQITDSEIINASPFLNGAAIYFVLQGSTDDWGFDAGLPPIQIRFELQNIQEYLNPNGPFASLLTINAEPTEIMGRNQHEYYGSIAFYDVKTLFKTNAAMHFLNNSKVKRAKKYHQRGEDKWLNTEYFYDELGRVITQYNYDSDEMKDSVVFEYVENSNYFKNIRTYAVDEDEEGDYHVWGFDELGNLRYDADGWGEDDSYYETWMEDAILYSYIGNYGFEETYAVSEYAMACTPGVTRLTFDGNRMVQSDNYPWPTNKKTVYLYNKKDKITKSFRCVGTDTTYYQGWTYNHNRLTRIDNLGSKNKFSTFHYDSKGRPIRYERTNQNGDDMIVVNTLEYNKKGLPIKRVDYRQIMYGPEIIYTYEYFYR